MSDFRAVRATSGLRWWEALLALAVLAGPPALRRREAEASLRGEIDLAVGIEIGVWLLAAGWVVLMCLRLREGEGRLEVRIPRPPWPVLCGIALGGILIVGGLFWSPAPALSVFRGFQLGLGAALAFLLVRRLDKEASVSFLRRGLAILCYLVLVAWVLDPGLVVHDRDQYFGLRGGVVAPASYVGLLLLVLTLADRSLLREGRGAAPRGRLERLASPFLDSRIVLIGVAIGLVVLARRRLGLALLAVTLILLLVRLGRRKSLSARVAVGAGLALILMAAGIGSAVVWEWWVRNPGQIGTLSHRLPLWTHLLDALAVQEWLLGAGFAAVSRVLGPEARPGLADAHSSFVEILVGGGIVGIALYVAVWAFLLYRAFLALLYGGRLDVALGWGAICLFAVAQLTSHVVFPTPVSFTFWVLVAVAAMPRR